MFDRRVKIFLAILVLVTLVLMGRVLQLQVLGKSEWDKQAELLMTTDLLVETTRGRLLDRNGYVMAEDAPCIDAAVDYRVILFEPLDAYVSQIAGARVRSRVGESYRSILRSQRIAMIDQEKEVVRSDIRIMWDKLAEVSGITQDQMDDLRRSILRKVGQRRQKVAYTRFNVALTAAQATTKPASWYEKLLFDESSDLPEIDEYVEMISEEREAHVIIPNVTNAVYNYLGKNRDRFPGLDLRASVHRRYPFHDVAAHVIGNLGKVTSENIRADQVNPLRDYEPNDLIGKAGLESLCETLLRGTRGKIERFVAGTSRTDRVTDPIPGGDVFVTLDMELHRDVQQIFEHVELTYKDGLAPAELEKLPMPGAAVVLDVPTNQVLAMASYPSYNLNEFAEIYSELAKDLINRRQLNRATQFALEPGSTVKPIVGLGAMTQGLIGPHDAIECTGYLVLGGQRYSYGRCWTMSAYGLAHHVNPFEDPHPNGMLTFSDSLQRSCNVYFETLGDRLGIAGLTTWYDRFGLGRATGLGIAESAGMIPREDNGPIKGNIQRGQRRTSSWFSAIGQDRVLATPIQMANVAATIARDGIWMRPRLLMNERTNPQTPADKGADRLDLHLSPAALAEAKAGMIKVVSTTAGTGRSMRMDHITVAGKTGSAQAAPLRLPVYEDGKRTGWKPLQMGTRNNPTPEAPWYRGWGDNEDRRSHAWVIGYAPAENPKIAFAVMVEYGGGGGATAGWVARQMLEACVVRGYLPKKAG